MAIVLSKPWLKTGDPATWPIPPHKLMEYRESPEIHVSAGHAAYSDMALALTSLDFDVRSTKRVLDFGCSNGRVTRWHERPEEREIWGCDIQQDKLLWAMENLSPPFRFFMNDQLAHLPFSDGYFDLIVAQSIFTHLQASHVAWILELSRILSPTGRMFITINNQHSFSINGFPKDPLFSGLDSIAPDLEAVSFLAMNPYINGLAMVYMTEEHLQRILPDHLQIYGSVEEAYARFQTAYVLGWRSPSAAATAKRVNLTSIKNARIVSG